MTRHIRIHGEHLRLRDSVTMRSPSHVDALYSTEEKTTFAAVQALDCPDKWCIVKPRPLFPRSIKRMNRDAIVQAAVEVDLHWKPLKYRVAEFLDESRENEVCESEI